MAKADLKRDPHDIRGVTTAWWYEAPKGIEVVMEAHPHSRIVTIPWKSIRAALARLNKPEAPIVVGMSSRARSRTIQTRLAPKLRGRQSCPRVARRSQHTARDLP